MYMSRVEIDFSKTKSKKDLNHVGAYHSWVENSFTYSDIKTSRKLWRIDSLNGKKYLSIVSEEKPNISKLEKYGVEGTAQIKDYSKFLNSLKTGLKVKFKVTLNPTICKKNNKNPNERGIVLQHVTFEHQEKFLISKSLKNGFKLDNSDFMIIERDQVILKHKNQRPVKLKKATYEGILEIIDIDKFINVLTKGLGKKKAYGFGLMTVLPIR